MDKTIRQHVQDLEARIRFLNDALTSGDALNKGEVNDVEAELRAAQTALEYYQTALEIEKRIFASISRPN
jgi:hypothetical protein